MLLKTVVTTTTKLPSEHAREVIAGGRVPTACIWPANVVASANTARRGGGHNYVALASAHPDSVPASFLAAVSVIHRSFPSWRRNARPEPSCTQAPTSPTVSRLQCQANSPRHTLPGTGQGEGLVPAVPQRKSWSGGRPSSGSPPAKTAQSRRAPSCRTARPSRHRDGPAAALKGT